MADDWRGSKSEIYIKFNSFYIELPRFNSFYIISKIF